MRLAQAAKLLEPRTAALALILLWSGARISEVLALRVIDLDLTEMLVVLRTLKRRRPHVREVPLPEDLLQRLDRTFDLSARQKDPLARETRIFSCARSTAWRLIKRLCAVTHITGLAASPKGFRHGFGVSTLQAGVPLTLVQKWLGHARLSTTAIYTDVIGPEERSLARRFWTWRGRE
jgi:integrase/recombinase XerD